MIVSKRGYVQQLGARGGVQSRVVTGALLVGGVTAGIWTLGSSEARAEAFEGVEERFRNGWSTTPRCFGLGSNKFGLLGPGVETDATVRKAQHVVGLDGVPLLGMALAERHGAAVDGQGNLLQWGEGHQKAGDVPMVQKIQGGGLVDVAVTEDKVYGLTGDGRMYVIAASEEQQEVDGKGKAVTEGTSEPQGTAQSWGDWILGRAARSMAFREVKLDSPLRDERIVQMATGAHHIVVRTSHGRVFSCASDAFGNRFGQLGRGDILPVGREGEDRTAGFATTLTLVRGLSDVEEVACGYSHTLARTTEGRGWVWGSNGWGQLAQGDYTAGLLTLAGPTEVRFITERVIGLAAGGLNSLFLTASPTEYQEEYALWSCGMGQWGTLGNGTFGHMQGTPVEVKKVSHLTEYNEAEKRVIAIRPREMHVGRHHAAVVLDLVTDRAMEGGVLYGSDILLWGHNMDGECGTGKRNNLPVPMYAQPVPEVGGIEGVSRLQLPPARQAGTHRVEGTVALGAGVTILYDRIVR